MKKVTIYTAADKRPDFIPVQYAAFKKYIADDYEFVVLNNAVDSKKRRKEVNDICNELGIRSIEVKKDPAFMTIGGEKVFTWLGKYRNANVGTSYPLQWAWQTICQDAKDGLFIIIDSDMFPCREVSFNQELGGNDAALVIQYRGPQHHRKEMLVTYPWNGICIFNAEKIPHLKDLSWASGVVNGFPVDVGGQSHFWLKQNPISVKHISEYAIHNFKIVDDRTTWLEATLNGNYHYSFSYNTETKVTSDYHCYETGWDSSDIILPHFPTDFVETLQQKTIAYYEKFILDKQTYPAPTFLGCIEFETFSEAIDPFIIHNKAGSGYMGFDKEYGTLKLQFIKKTLGV